MKKLAWTTIVASTAVLSLAACGSDSSESSADTTAAAAVAAAPAASGTVDPNNASAEEIAATIEAAGIDNADKWADEIKEYGPYDGSDAGWETLRGELAKYNASPEVIDQIIALLAV